MTIKRTYQFKNHVSELDRLIGELEDFGKKKNISKKCQQQIQLAIEEHFINIVLHGYADEDEHIIDIRLACENNVAEITIEDDGVPFNPLELSPPDTTLPLEERKIGGLGIHLARQCMDDITYQRKKNKNILWLKKKV